MLFRSPLKIPEYFTGSTKQDEDNIFIIIMDTEVNTLPRQMGMVFDISKRSDFEEVRKYMDISEVQYYPEDMKGKCIRVLAEDTPSKLIPLAIGFAGIDKCYLIGNHTPMTFKVATAILQE